MIIPIYRTAVCNLLCELVYVSDILYSSKELALKAVNEISCKKEQEIKTYKWVAVYIPGIDTWRTFEKVKNDNNERYIGIIKEILIVD